jgi:molybdopterin-containing oxidoreductase family membrane subunit
MILTFQVLRKVAKIEIQDKALLKIAEMMLIVLIVSLLLFFAELVTELRSATAHTVHIQFYFGSHSGEGGLGAWAWTGAACNITAFILLLFPKTRTRLLTLNIACVLVFVGVFIEKGIGLVLPGFFPGTLGETYEYVPSLQELKVGAGIAAIGGLVFSILSKAAIPLVFKGTSKDANNAVVEEDGAGDSGDVTYSRARSPEDSVLTGNS